MKTGFTNGAGRCIVLSATRNNWQLIFVILGCNTSKERTNDSIRFIEYCFDKYELMDINMILKSNEKKIQVEVNKGEKKHVTASIDGKQRLIPILKKDREKIKIEKVYDKIVDAPVRTGQNMGRIIFKIEDKEIFKADLKSEKNISKKTEFIYFREMLISIPKYFEQL